MQALDDLGLADIITPHAHLTESLFLTSALSRDKGPSRP